MSARSVALLLLYVLSLAFVTGCQSASPAASAPPTIKSAVVTTGNGTTSIYLPTADGGFERLASSDAPRCAQCDADVAAYFKGGALAPKCSVCGATHVAVSSSPASGHQ